MSSLHGQTIINFTNQARYFSYMSTLWYIYILFIFQYLIKLNFIISNTDKHEFSSIWKWRRISCHNNIMNGVDMTFTHRKLNYVLKISRYIIFFFVLKISVVYQKNIPRCYRKTDYSFIFKPLP